jgi:predicted alpha-1,2-mannosidase
MKQHTSADRPSRSARLLSLTTAAALAITMAQFFVPATVAHAITEFTSDFETADAAPLASTTYTGLAAGGGTQNVSGKAANPGSLQVYIDEASMHSNGNYPPGENREKVIDLIPSTKWLVFAPGAGDCSKPNVDCQNFPLWVTLPLTSAQKVVDYALTSANDSQSRDPREWYFQGCKLATTGTCDGTIDTDWVNLDHRNDTFWTSAERLTRRVFTIPDANQDAYDAYRFYIVASGATSGAQFQLGDIELLDGTTNPAAPWPMATYVGAGPMSDRYSLYRSGVGFTGTGAYYYSGVVTADGDAKTTNVIYDNLNLTVGANTELSYKIFPVSDNFTSDYQPSDYPSGYVAVGVEYTDGATEKLTTVEGDIVDGSGIKLTPQEQGDNEMLYNYMWNSVKADLSPLAGKVINKIVVSWGNDAAEEDAAFSGWIDDLKIADALDPYDPTVGLVSYTDTRRGTYSSTSFSRGLNVPITTTPHGFNFFGPMTNNAGSQWYSYQSSNSGTDTTGVSCINCTPFKGVIISHEPSYWMGDRDQFAFAPANNTDAAYDNRVKYFEHENETARADYYGVTLEEKDGTSGGKVEVTPSDHGAILRFTFAGNTGYVLSDNPSTGSVTVSGDTVTGTADHGGDSGRSTMYVYGKFDATPTSTGTATGRTNAGYSQFNTTSDKTVELAVATSYISAAQAQHNYELELQGKDFDQVHAEAITTWNNVLSAVDVSGATNVSYVAKVRLYSSLYRLNAYPNMQHENTGTNAIPVWQYVSPVNSDHRVNNGKMYVNNGFWDTYRTAWPAYALLWPDMAAELVDGMVEMYRAGGWVSRWSSPGYSNMMTGTSSDASFAEAYIAGVLSTQQALDAWDAGVQNATVLSPSADYGRKGLDTSQYIGYTSTATGESVSWGLEGYINDAALGYMGAKLATDPAVPAARQAEIADMAKYLAKRAENYANYYEETSGIFQGRTAAGDFVIRDRTYWGSEFTETNAWNFAFHVPYDVSGLASLYGGLDGLIAELDSFFTTPEKADNPGGYGGSIHEMTEAREVRMGQYGGSNQVSHHIPWIYAAAGKPSSTQQYTREALRRLFVGEDIGEGYPGDEDNGEMSAWYIFASLGFYPLSLASGEYTIGSPLFDHAVIHRGSDTITINAVGNSEYNQYVSGVSVDGTPLTSASLPQSAIFGGNHTVTYTMSATPNDSWVSDPAFKKANPLQDVATGTTLVSSDGTSTGNITDNNSNSSVTFTTQTPTLTWTSTGDPVAVTQYTITNAATFAWPSTGDTASPQAWKLEGSNDGISWTLLDTQSNQAFNSATQLRAFVVDTPAAYTQYKLTVTAGNGANLKLAEVELLSDITLNDTGDLAFKPATLTASAGEAVTLKAGEVTGGSDDPSEYSATADFGSGPEAATVLTSPKPGVQVKLPAHTFAAPGVYDVVLSITHTPAAGTPATITGYAQVSVTLPKSAFEASFNSTCLGEIGQGVNCDNTNMSYPLSDLKADRTGGLTDLNGDPTGYEPGEIVKQTLASTQMYFDIPAKGAPDTADNVLTTGATFTLKAPAGAAKISFVGFATEGNYGGTGSINYSDGTSEPITVWFNDWCQTLRTTAPAEQIFAQATTRLSGNSRESGNCANPKMRVSEPQAFTVPAGESVVSFTMPNLNGGAILNGSSRIPHSHLFAIGFDAPPTKVKLAAAAVPNKYPDEQPITATLATVTNGTPTTAVINWGDHSPAQQVSVSGTSVSGSHTYAQPGTYTVTVTATDGDSASTATTEVKVVAPTITASPATAGWGDTVTVSGDGFSPGETVTITTAAAAAPVTVVVASGQRTFTKTFTVNYGVTSGTYPVYAIGSVSSVQTEAQVGVTEPDTTQLDTATAAAAGLTQGNYSAASWKAVQDALDAAAALASDPTLTQSEIDAVLSALQSAINSLVQVDGLNSALGAVYNTATNTYVQNENDYTASSWQTLVSAVEAAKTVAQQALQTTGGPTQAQVNNAISQLTTASTGLTPRPSAATTASLTSQIGDAQTKAASGAYEPSAALTSAIAAAQDVVAHPENYSQAQADSALTALQNAVNALVPISAAATEMASKIGQADAIDTSGYTDDSVAALNAALADAKAKQAAIQAGTLSSSDPSVAAALAALNSAISGLAPKSATGPTTDPTTDPTTGSTTGPTTGPTTDPNPTANPTDGPKTPVVTAAKVKYPQKALVLAKGKTYTLPVGVYFNGTTAPSYKASDVTWTTSNKKVATVSAAGKIKAVKAGTATIKATAKAKSAAGKAVSVSIKVKVVAKKSSAKVTKVKAAVPKTMKVGQVKYVTATYSPAKAQAVKVTYKSSKAKVVAVDKAGRITALKKGTATITVKAAKKSVKYKVTVK